MAKRKKSNGLLTPANILRLAAAVLAIAAFCFMIGNQVKVTANLWVVSLNGELSFSDTFFSNGGSPIGFSGYLLVLVCGLGAFMLAVAKLEKGAKTLVNLLVAVVLLAGAVLVFLTAAPINGASLLIMPILAGVFGSVATVLVCCAFVLDK